MDVYEYYMGDIIKGKDKDLEKQSFSSKLCTIIVRLICNLLSFFFYYLIFWNDESGSASAVSAFILIVIMVHLIYTAMRKVFIKFNIYYVFYKENVISRSILKSFLVDNMFKSFQNWKWERIWRFTPEILFCLYIIFFQVYILIDRIKEFNIKELDELDRKSVV